MNQDLTTYQDLINPITEQADTLEITCADEMLEAVTLLSQLNKQSDKITAEKERITKPLNEALKAERGRWKPLETVLDGAIATIRNKMSKYQTEAEQRATEAQEAIAARIKPGTGNLSIETAVKKLATIDTPDKKVESETGSVRFTKTKKFEVTDITLLPTQYLLANEVAIRKAMKEGTELPGVRYYEELVPVNSR